MEVETYQIQGGFSNNNFMVFGVLALGIGASILKLPQKKEEI